MMFRSLWREAVSPIGVFPTRSRNPCLQWSVDNLAQGSIHVSGDTMSPRKQLQLLLGVIVFGGVWEGGQAQSVTQAISSHAVAPGVQAQAVQPAKSSVPDSPPSARTSLNDTTEVDYSVPAPGAIILAAAGQTAGGPMPNSQGMVASIAGATAHGAGVLSDSATGALRARPSAQVSEARSGPRDSTPPMPAPTIPEPTHGTMLLCGLAVVAFMARRKSSLVKN
jgi:hypothetical protein